MKFAFFPGCMIQVRYPQMEAAVRKTVPTLGIELVDLPGLGCCPDPVFFKSAAQARLADPGGAQPGHRRAGGTGLRDHLQRLHRDPVRGGAPAERGRRAAGAGQRAPGPDRPGIRRGRCNTRHLITVLRDEVGWRRSRPRSRGRSRASQVAVHYGCHLLKPRDDHAGGRPRPSRPSSRTCCAPSAPTPVDHTERIVCCGKSCRECDLPEEMTRTVLESVHAAGVDVMGVICPSCFDIVRHGADQGGPASSVSSSPCRRSTTSSCWRWRRGWSRRRWGWTSTSSSPTSCWRRWRRNRGWLGGGIEKALLFCHVWRTNRACMTFPRWFRWARG